jgi:cytochrome c553
MKSVRSATFSGVILLTVAASALPGQESADTGFDRDVRPVIAGTCAACHNAERRSGGLNLVAINSGATVAAQQDVWEKILRKVRAGEMPPKGIPRPPQATMEAMMRSIEAELDQASRNAPRDPGRVTVRRLNRNEYANSVRDLLGVSFRAADDFPSDDSGEGFDNLADVLSISPLLMEKYVAAAEKIAARAVGNVPLPKPTTTKYDADSHNLTRVDVSTAEATHKVDFDADYDVLIGMPGARPGDAAPVDLGLFMDGELIHKMKVETKESDLVYFGAFSDAHFRVTLPVGEHVFRAVFLNDPYIATIPEKDYFRGSVNKYPATITFTGPYLSAEEPASRKQIFTCDVKADAGCAQAIVSRLARRAYRRPATQTEVASLMKLVALAKANGDTSERGIQLAVQAVLVSPNFLYRIERDPDPTDAAKIHRVTDLELATRLSYFLWSTLPDEELLETADQGHLHEPAILDAQVKRMLQDKRAAALVDNFAGQWLELRNLDSIKPDPDKFLIWGPELKNAMQTETRLFLEYVLRENRPLSELLDARYTFLNERLAKFYDIPGITGPEFRKVELTTDQRGGILTQASVLTVSRYPTRTSPTIRGKYILNNILGTPPPPPPPDVPALDASKVGTEVSLRKQLEEHRSNAVCSSCHSRMDVLGFGLENYNAIGRWRTMDGKFPIDSGGTLPGGKTFVTPSEMKAVLLRDNMPEFARCVTEKMLIYALGRGIQPFDRPVLNQIDADWKADNYAFQDLISEVVRSLPFQSRRGEAVTQKPKPVQKDVASR